MNITVMGAGAWGTALAVHFAQQGHEVALWSHRKEHAQQMQAVRHNERYLSGFSFPASLKVFDDTVLALQNSQLVLVVTPVSGLRGALDWMKQAGVEKLPVLLACKGFEQNSGLLPFQVAQQMLPENGRIGVLSGPSFAHELVQGLPCAVCLASQNFDWIQSLAIELNTKIMRLYANADVVGVSVGGAVKNVMAIASGLSDGLECGLNARAALMTRGLAEMTRLAVALGAQAQTMMGLAGMGDLILTCTGALSRNRQVGLGLAQGKTLPQILQELGHIAEGVPTVNGVCCIAEKHHIEMPISTVLQRLLNGEINANEVVQALMQRDPTSE